MLRNLTFLLLALVASMISLSMANSIADRTLGNRLLKKSERPEWEDLGFAWGKRSAPSPIVLPTNEQLSLQRFVRSWKADKKANEANWDDLGFAWGK